MNDPGQRNAQLPHILYADSDTELQKKFLNYCTDHSPASVIPAASANEVLEIITSKPVDALVLADNLSDMTVANLLINIREQKKAFPIILFTESCDPVDVPEADLVELCLKRGKQPSRKFRELTTLTLEAAERQQVLRELSENERRLTDIINFLPDATLAINREGVVIIWNKAIETMTGIPAEKILGKSNYDYSIPFYGERRPILVDIILSGSEVNEENYQVIERQENRIVVEAFARALNRGKGAYLWGIVSPLYDGQGKIIGAIESIRDITERRKTENALKERENQYRSLVEASPDLIWEVTKNGIFKYLSPNCADILGYTAEELIGTSIHQFAPRKSLSKYDKTLKMLGASRSFQSAVVDARHRDGHLLTLEIRSTPILDKQGRITGMRGVTRDITEMLKIQEELRLSEEKNRKYIEGSPAGILVFNDSFQFLDVNTKALELTGYSRREILKKRISEMVPREFFSVVNQQRDHLFEKGELIGESVLKRKDGTNLPVFVNAIRLPDQTYLSFVTDISELETIRAELRESETLYHTLFENIADAVLLHGLTAEGLPGKFTALNEAACRQLGYSREELLQLSVRDIEAPASYAEARDRARKIKTKGHAIFEAVQVRKDGSTLPVEVSVHVFRYRDQQMVLALARDISERKKFENQLRESEERYSSLFYQNYSVSLLIDPDSGRIADANTAACDYYGYSYDELKDRSLSEINGVPEEKILKNLREAKKEREKHFFSVHRLKDGRKRDVEVYSGPIKVGGKRFFYSIIHDITDKKEAENKLVQLLEERTELLKEIHHRVNNNLQVLLSLSTLERISFKDELDSDPLAEKLLSDMEKRITAIALVHENLFLSGDLTEIRLVEHLRILAQEILMSVVGGAYISYDVKGSSEIILDLDRAVLVSLVASEILANIQNHAFVDRQMGTVMIRVTEDSENKQLLLGIADDGVGLPEGLDPEYTESVGLSLIFNIITLQLHGTITVDRDKGTAYHITFPY